VRLPGEPGEAETLLILEKIRGGDSEGWSELYRRYHDPLLFWIRMNMGSRLRRFLQSEDIFQSVALEWLRELDRFEYRGTGSLQRFLRRLILNKIRDRAEFHRAEKRGEPEALDEDRVPAVLPPSYQDPETFERLERALLKLPEAMRDVVLLHKVEGLSTKEVASRLGKSDEAVRKTYSRALAKLALEMGGI
jgi:RNA polymerase sigma-70 factor (ECF subfamily)